MPFAAELTDRSAKLCAKLQCVPTDI